MYICKEATKKFRKKYASFVGYWEFHTVQVLKAPQKSPKEALHTDSFSATFSQGSTALGVVYITRNSKRLKFTKTFLVAVLSCLKMAEKVFQCAEWFLKVYHI